MARNAALFAAFLAGYLLLDWVSRVHPAQTFHVTPWSPQAALAIALVMLRGRRWLAGVAIAIVCAEIVVRGAPHSAGAMLLTASVLTLGYGAMAHALAGPLAVHPRLEDRRDVARLIGVVLVGTLLTAVVLEAARSAFGIGTHRDFASAAVKFWIGHCVGVLVALPLILLASDPARRGEMRRLLGRPESIAQALAIAAALSVVFGLSAGEPVRYSYLLFLPLVWVAARHGMTGAAIAVALIQAGLVAGVLLAGTASAAVFELQALQAALALTGFSLGVAADERRRAVEEMHRTSRLATAGRLAAALAHELSQPLTALASYTRAARMLAGASPPDPARLDATLARAGAEAQRAADIVQRVRNLFGAGQPDLQAADCAELVRQAVAAVRDRALSAHVSVETALPDHLPALRVDPLQMDVVLRNLLNNAIEAASDARSDVRTVTIGAERATAGRPGDGVRLWVRDTGPGVAADVVDRLFEPLVSSKPAGMGMGLAISRAIVEAHGGRISCVAGANGMFVIELPAAAGAS